jgi:hypothetical protein
MSSLLDIDLRSGQYVKHTLHQEVIMKMATLLGRLFLTVLSAGFGILFLCYLVYGRTPAQAATEAGIWAAIGAALFTAGHFRRLKRGQACALCRV